MLIEELNSHFAKPVLSAGVLRVLVACEESQSVTKELRKLGHEAFSCDVLPESGVQPELQLIKIIAMNAATFIGMKMLMKGAGNAVGDVFTGGGGNSNNSSNNGGSWTSLYKLKDIYFSNLYFRTKNVGVITGYTNTVLITNDGGNTFTNAYPGLNAYYDQGFISLNDTIFLVGTNRAIVKTSDYGVTWTLLNTDLGDIPDNVIHFYGIFMLNLNIPH